MLAILIYLDGQGLVGYTLLAAAMHEMGHWITIRLLGGRVAVLSLTAVGAEMKTDPRYPLSYGREAVAAAAGPAVNLCAALLLVHWGWYLFGGIHLCLGLFNLIPVFPLDGGRVLHCALSWKLYSHAEQITKAVAVVFSGLLLGLGWAAWREWGNIALLMVALWLVFGVLKQ